MSEANSERTIFDIATILTIAGVIFFHLAWTYWKSYFSILSVDFSFIEMPFEKYLATTWYMLYAIIPGFIIIGQYKYLNKEYDILGLIFAMGTLFFSISIHLFPNSKMYLAYLFFGFVIFYLVYTITIRDKENILNKKLKWTPYIYLFILIVIFLSCHFFYQDKGEKDGKQFLSTFNNNIEVVFNDKTRAKGKFISYMNGKYFILIKDKKGKNQTFILNDIEVHHVKFIK